MLGEGEIMLGEGEIMLGEGKIGFIALRSPRCTNRCYYLKVTFIGKFFLLVLVLGFAELYLLVGSAQVIGFGGTLALCILTGVIGGSLVRHQGLRTLQEIQTAMAQGQVPAVEIVSGVVLLLVGAMLLTPGFITDTFGFLMLVPPIRMRVARLGAKMIEGRVLMSGMAAPGKSRRTGQVIDIDPHP